MLRLQLQVGLASPVAAVVLGLFFTSCAEEKKSSATAATSGPWYSVTAAQTPFYHYGPKQGNGPDSQLPRDSIMKVILPSFGYVKVQLQDGENGYVSSEDIGPANPSVVAEKLAPPPSPDPVIASQDQDQEEQFQLNSNDPRLIAPPEPLPEASPKPDLHY
jgi:hypothetical protein